MSSLAIEQVLFKNVNTMLTEAFLIPGEAKSQLEALCNLLASILP